MHLSKGSFFKFQTQNKFTEKSLKIQNLNLNFFANPKMYDAAQFAIFFFFEICVPYQACYSAHAKLVNASWPEKNYQVRRIILLLIFLCKFFFSLSRIFFSSFFGVTAGIEPSELYVRDVHMALWHTTQGSQPISTVNEQTEMQNRNNNEDNAATTNNSKYSRHGVGRADLHGYLAGGPQVTQHDLDQAPETADHKVQQ